MDLDELMNNLEQNEQQNNNRRVKNQPNQGIPHD